MNAKKPTAVLTPEQTAMVMTAMVMFTPQQTATMLGVTMNTLAVWRCKKRYPLKYVKIGSKVRYRQADIEKFIAARVVAA